MTGEVKLPFSFLDLPAELRAIIYRKFYEPNLGPSIVNEGSIALLSTCRLIHNEALPVLHACYPAIEYCIESRSERGRSLHHHDGMVPFTSMGPAPHQNHEVCPKRLADHRDWRPWALSRKSWRLGLCRSRSTALGHAQSSISESQLVYPCARSTAALLGLHRRLDDDCVAAA